MFYAYARALQLVHQVLFTCTMYGISREHAYRGSSPYWRGSRVHCRHLLITVNHISMLPSAKSNGKKEQQQDIMPRFASRRCAANAV